MKKFMKKFMEKYKMYLLKVIIIVLLGIIFFSYNITLTWDSSEYLGLAEYIGTDEMTDKWLGHRGIGFPLLLKLFKPFGIENKICLLILMFIFYIGMVITIYKIYKKLKENEKPKNINMSYIFLIYCIVFIILNPIIFGYYHTLLTEFVSMTITLLMCYLTWKWIDLTWKENKKSIIIYAIIFSLLTIFLYHVKQSLVPLAILPIIISSLISIINKCKLSNILSKIITILFVCVMLIVSIEIWNLSMKNANVAEDTNDYRVKGRLIIGINTLESVCDETTIKYTDIDRSKISSKDNEEINNVISNVSEYTKFTIYKTSSNDKYLVRFNKEEYSFKEDVIFYIKVLFNSPLDIIESYYDSYYKMIFISEKCPIWLTAENSVIPLRIYLDRENVVDVNLEYEQFIENYRSVNDTNIVSKIFNKYVEAAYIIMTVYMKISLAILPILWIITIICYIIFNSKINKEQLKILQLIIILYTVSFGGIMSYIIFGATVDRYIIPMIIPTFIAQFLIIYLAYYFLTNLKNKNFKKVSKK